jgi:hypothetical protein
VQNLENKIFGILLIIGLSLLVIGVTFAVSSTSAVKQEPSPNHSYSWFLDGTIRLVMGIVIAVLGVILLIAGAYWVFKK